MPITKTQTGKDGTLWGWEASKGDWVELDPAMEQGNILGNLGRAAGRGFQDVGQGISELGYLQDDPIHPERLTQEQQQLANQGQLLEAQQGAAAQSAPIAEAVGGSAPEVLAGVGAGLATGGMGLLPAIAGQGAAGAFTGFLRPGDAQERAANAALGGVLGVLGEVALPVAQAAFRGMRAGLNMGEAITGRAAARGANELDGSLTRAEASAAARGEAGAADAAIPERERVARDYWAQRATDLQREQGGSVGAAATPEGELGEQAIRENQALKIDEASGANTSNKYDIHQRARMEAEGYKSPLGAQTRLGSMARAAESVDEYSFDGSINKAFRANNQKMAVQYASRAMGDLDWASRETLELSDLADTGVRLEQTFDKLDTMAPAIDGKVVAKEIRKVIKPTGIFGDREVQSWLKKTLEAADNTVVEDGATMMENLRAIRNFAMTAAKEGDSKGAEQLVNLHRELAEILSETAKRQGNDEFAGIWDRANAQYRVMKMLEASGAISGTRDINPKSLLGKMKAPKTNYGYGSAGPDRATPEGKLWDLVSLMDKDQTHVAATGARGLLVRKAAKVAGTVAAGGVGAGLAGASGLFD